MTTPTAATITGTTTTDPNHRIESSPRRSRVGSAIDRLLQSLVVAIVVLADVLAFNQLATQSPIDGLLQLTVIGVGLAGSIEAVRRLVFGPAGLERLLGAPLAALGVAATIGWRAQWPVGAGVLACALAAIVVAVIGVRALAVTARSADTSQFVAILTVAQAMILVWFALLAGADARGVLFG